MKANLIRMMAGILAVIALSAPAVLSAQVIPPPPPSTPPPPPPQQVPRLSPAQLDQLLAPIALYPDALLSQILMASTYPLEVVEADRWVRDPDHAGLGGNDLTSALEEEDWDPSVKSLAPFPQILKMMDDNLQWTRQLGDAFLAQQADVMDSVQRLRAQAQTAGTLKSTPEQTVITAGSDIMIQPASPDLVYVPYYSPAYVYAPWPYPDYPPYYFPSPYSYYGSGSGIFFGVGVGIIAPLWGWDYFDWRHHRIHIDHDRYDHINRYAIDRRNRPRFAGEAWDHDPYHRRGVPYRDPGTRMRFLGAGPSDARRDFRGYAPTGGAAVIPAPGGQPVVGPRAVPPATRQPPMELRTMPRAGAAVIPAPGGQPVVGPRVAPPASVMQQPMTMQRPQPPAFEGIARLPEVQRQIERAQQSRQYLPRSMQPGGLALPRSTWNRSYIPAPGGQPVVGPRTAPAGRAGQIRR